MQALRRGPCSRLNHARMIGMDDRVRTVRPGPAPSTWRRAAGPLKGLDGRHAERAVPAWTAG